MVSFCEITSRSVITATSRGFAILMYLSFLSLLAISVPVLAVEEESEYPGRHLFPKVKHISTETLASFMHDYIVIDVRSTYEFEILHINNSINIPLASRDFIAKVRVIEKRDDRNLVMYCNGKTCMKSYEAVLKCQNNKIKGVLAYDSGIMEWARTFPRQAILLGTELNSTKRLISNKEFKSHSISPDAFATRMANFDDIVIDIRDPYQREGISMFVGREHRVLLDQKKRIDRYIRKAKQTGKALLIYDAAGKQVRWLQYYLNYKGLKKFYFMDGGIRAYYKQMVTESLLDKG